MKFLEKLESLFSKKRFPKWWRRGDSLRYFYACKFKEDIANEVKKTLIFQRILTFLEFCEKVVNKKLKKITLGFIVNW